MLLAVDIGNTNVVCALFEKDEVVCQWRMYSDVKRTSDEYATTLSMMMKDSGYSADAIDSAIVSSVVPLLTGPWISVTERITGHKPIIVGSSVYDKLPIKIPAVSVNEIGTDIVCNAVQAYTSLKKACIVVDFGTALTLTAIDNDGNIIGVSIAPGLRTAVNSLFNNTAQVPSVPLEAPPDSLGTNTIHSVQSGIVLGYKGLVEYLISCMKKDTAAKTGINPDDMQVLATGGLNSVLKPITSVFQTVDKLLTLKGLNTIANICR
ncbi:MAG: type III pantothenate kinase [Treponema sp.]|nr:type III pantothenate kinase [Candidatus Treponema caballi]